jgi:hypothetical protein
MKIIYLAIAILSVGVISLWYAFTPPKGSLTLESATMQEWAGGAAGSGRGTTYRIIVKKKAKKAVKVSSVWVGDAQNGRTIDFTVTTAPKDNKDVNLSDKMEDIANANKILIEATLRIPGQKRRLPDDPEIPEEDTPKQTEKQVCGIDGFKGEGYVAYSMGKKIQYLVIDKFEKLEKIFYP